MASGRRGNHKLSPGVLITLLGIFTVVSEAALLDGVMEWPVFIA